MKILVDRKMFLEAFKDAASVAPKKSPKPILMNIKIEAKEDGTTLLATDLELDIRRHAPLVEVHSPGSAILATARMKKILMESTDEQLAIETDAEGSVIVKGLRDKFRLAAEDAEFFPVLKTFDAESFHSVAAADFRRAVKRTVFATEIESTRYALGGVLFELCDESIVLVATDGRRLAQTVIAAEPNSTTPPNGSFVVPVKTLDALVGMINDDDDPIQIAFVEKGDDKSVSIRTRHSLVRSRLVEGRFPRYQDVFPASCNAKIVFRNADLLQAVSKAAIVSNDETRGVDFLFATKSLKLSGESRDVGSSDIEIPTEYDGEPISVTFDALYLVEMLKVLADDANVTAELVDHKSACVFRTEDDYAYVIMPLTRER